MIQIKVKTKTPIIVVAGPTGGCGKTTIVINLASEFAAQKRKVLVIDLCRNDAVNHIGANYISANAAWNPIIAQRLPINHVRPGFSGVDYIPHFNFWINQLPIWLNNYASLYDVVLIDCPPRLQMIAEATFPLVTHYEAIFPLATHYIVAVDAESGYSANNLPGLAEDICAIADKHNSNLKYLGALLNRVQLANICRIVRSGILNLTNCFADPSGTRLSTLFPVEIRSAKCVGEASVFKVPVKRASGNEGVAQDYTHLANYLINCVPV